MKRIGVLASGNGTNFLSLKKAADNNEFRGEIVCLASDRKNPPVFEKASSRNVPYLSVPLDRKSPEGSRLHEDGVLAFLESHNVDTVVLAGYMRILSPDFLGKFRDPELGACRVINIHPTLLPAFPGKDGYERAWVKGLRVMGCTVHFVDDGVDSGPIILQRSFEVNPWESIESVKARGLELEHRTFSEAMKLYCDDRLKVEKRVLGKYSENAVSVLI